MTNEEWLSSDYDREEYARHVPEWRNSDDYQLARRPLPYRSLWLTCREERLHEYASYFDAIGENVNFWYIGPCGSWEELDNLTIEYPDGSWNILWIERER